MSNVHNNSQFEAFYSLDKPRRDAIVMLFEDSLTDEEIAKKVNRTRRTLAKWKNDPAFKAGQQAYRKALVKDDYESSALRKLKSLLNARSEMVQLQSATTLLKLSGMLSDNSTPELDKARIRKANADARVAEARAKSMEDNGQDMELLLDKMLDKVESEDEKRGAESGADS